MAGSAMASSAMASSALRDSGVPDFHEQRFAVVSPLLQSRRRFGHWRFRHWLAAAGVLHILLACAICFVGQRQLMPAIFDVNGIGLSYAHDGVVYRKELMALTRVLYERGIMAWLDVPTQTHVRFYCVPFAVLSPLVGTNILSIEPLNLLIYLTILSLVWKLALEIFDRRAAMLAFGVVALWPSFLLHTTQLLRDPLFIAAALGLVLINVIWLTRILQWRQAWTVGGAAIAWSVLLWWVKFKIWPVFMALNAFALGCLVLRQWSLKRLLPANLAGMALLLLATTLVPRAFPQTNVASFYGGEGVTLPPEPTPTPAPRKPRPKTAGGTSSVESAEPEPTAIPTPAPNSTPPLTLASRIDYQRRGFIWDNHTSNANIDVDVRLRSNSDIIAYLPRALQVGLCAPFPNMWFIKSGSSGGAARLLSAFEMLVIYLFEALALVALWQNRRRSAVWLMTFMAGFGLMAMSLIVINLGALFRMRYVFWMLLIIMGAGGASALMASFRSRSLAAKRIERAESAAV